METVWAEFSLSHCVKATEIPWNYNRIHSVAYSIQSLQRGSVTINWKLRNPGAVAKQSRSFSALSALRMLHKEVLQLLHSPGSFRKRNEEGLGTQGGIMCMADSALALHRAQCPQQKTPGGKSLGEDGDFPCLIQEKPCLGWPEPVCPPGSCSEAWDRLKSLSQASPGGSTLQDSSPLAKLPAAQCPSALLPQSSNKIGQKAKNRNNERLIHVMHKTHNSFPSGHVINFQADPSRTNTCLPALRNFENKQQ